MSSSVVNPSFLLNSKDIQAETFRKFGIDYSPDQNIPQEALQVIECLARACLPIIGEYCRDAIRLHEAKFRPSGAPTEDEHDVDSDELASTIQTLQSKHKRLTAQKEVDRFVSVACQTSSEMLNRGAHILQKTAPLLTVPKTLSQHLQALEQIHVPKLLRPEGTVSSLAKLTDVASTLDEVAKYSIQCFLQKRVFDYSDGERAVGVLSNAVSDLNSKIQKLGSAPRDTKLGCNILNILAHVCGLEKLSKNVLKICSNRENLSVQFGENIAKRCTEILSSKDAKLTEFNMRAVVDTKQVTDTELLQHNLVETIQRLCAQVNSNEAIEDKIRSRFTEISNTREIQNTNNFLPMHRNLFQMVNPISITNLPFKSPTTMFNETLVDFDLENRMEKLEIEQDENATALQYLSKLEFGVDASQILKATLEVPSGNVDEIVEELTTSETLLALCDPVLA